MIISLLSYHDEAEDMLLECMRRIASFTGVLITADGPYEHYPAGKPIHPKADASLPVRAGIQQAIHYDRVSWESEIAKRNYMITSALLIAEPEDWIYIVDADEYAVTNGLTDLHNEGTRGLVGMYSHSSIRPGFTPAMMRLVEKPSLMPRFYRADTLDKIVGTHENYTTKDGSPWQDFLVADFSVMHNRRLRRPERLSRQESYYQTKRALRLESLPTTSCAD